MTKGKEILAIIMANSVTFHITLLFLLLCLPVHVVLGTGLGKEKSEVVDISSVVVHVHENPKGNFSHVSLAMSHMIVPDRNKAKHSINIPKPAKTREEEKGKYKIHHMNNGNNYRSRHLDLLNMARITSTITDFFYPSHNGSSNSNNKSNKPRFSFPSLSLSFPSSETTSYYPDSSMKNGENSYLKSPKSVIVVNNNRHRRYKRADVGATSAATSEATVALTAVKGSSPSSGSSSNSCLINSALRHVLSKNRTQMVLTGRVEDVIVLYSNSNNNHQYEAQSGGVSSSSSNTGAATAPKSTTTVATPTPPSPALVNANNGDADTISSTADSDNDEYEFPPKGYSTTSTMLVTWKEKEDRDENEPITGFENFAPKNSLKLSLSTRNEGGDISTESGREVDPSSNSNWTTEASADNVEVEAGRTSTRPGPSLLYDPLEEHSDHRQDQDQKTAKNIIIINRREEGAQNSDSFPAPTQFESYFNNGEENEENKEDDSDEDDDDITGGNQTGRYRIIRRRKREDPESEIEVEQTTEQATEKDKVVQSLDLETEPVPYPGLDPYPISGRNGVMVDHGRNEKGPRTGINTGAVVIPEGNSVEIANNHLHHQREAELSGKPKPKRNFFSRFFSDFWHKMNSNLKQIRKKGLPPRLQVSHYHHHQSRLNSRYTNSFNVNEKKLELSIRAPNSEENGKGVFTYYRDADHPVVSIPSSPKYAMIVKVKRVIRGDRALENTAIIIDGFGYHQPASCAPSRVSIKDTKIFILDVDPDKRLTLAMQPLPVTLKNLQRIDEEMGMEKPTGKCIPYISVSHYSISPYRPPHLHLQLRKT